MDPVWAAREGLMLESVLHCSGLNCYYLPSASFAGDMICRILNDSDGLKAADHAVEGLCVRFAARAATPCCPEPFSLCSSTACAASYKNPALRAS